MTVVSWNVKGAQGPRDWSGICAVLARLGADVALLQEARPEWLDDRSVFLPGGIPGRNKFGPWGSAVVALTAGIDLEPIVEVEGQWRGRPQGRAPLSCVSDGHVASAVAQTPAGPLSLISAYGLIQHGYAAGTMMRTLADIEPIFDDPDLGRNLILAGDWNIGTWWSGGDRKYVARHGAVLALVQSYGLTDCIDAHLPQERGRLEGCPCEFGDDCRHVWTHKRAKSKSAYQDDYVYASAGVSSRVVRAEPDPEWDWDLGISDHIPLVLTIANPA